MIIGRVYQNTNNKTFVFSSNQYFPLNFVETYYEDNTENNKKIISKIVSVNAINKKFNSPDFIRFVESNEVFSDDALYIYTAIEISCIDVLNNKIINEFYPHFPGQRVFETDYTNVKQAYDLNEQGVEIGFLENMNNNKVKLDLEKIFNPHLTILGRTGSGKTYFVSRFIPNILDSFVYVFSPTNEYNNIHEINKNFKIIEKKDIVLNYNIENISYYYGLNMSEERVLSSIQIDNNKIYSNNDLIKLIEIYYAKKTIASHNYQQISFLDDNLSVKDLPTDEINFPQYALTLMDKLKKRNLKFSVKKESTLPDLGVFDLSDLSQLEQECIINAFLFKIYRRQKSTNDSKRKKCYIFFEEAHNFIPSQKNTLCKNMIIKLAREGRKYGINLCFITQRPRYFDQTAFSQTSNKIIFGMSHPDDIKYSLDDCIYYDENITSSIQSLMTGECIINGTAYKTPLMVHIDI